jgi:hypothetical protein
VVAGFCVVVLLMGPGVGAAHNFSRMTDPGPQLPSRMAPHAGPARLRNVLETPRCPPAGTPRIGAIAAPWNRGHTIRNFAMLGALVGGVWAFREAVRTDSYLAGFEVALGALAGAGFGALTGLLVAPSPTPEPGVVFAPAPLTGRARSHKLVDSAPKGRLLSAARETTPTLQ